MINKIGVTMEENNNKNDYNTIDPTRHSLDILKAAIPYINRRTQRSINIAIMASELANTLKDSRSTSELSACDVEPFEFNMEGMLVSIKEVCTKPEREMIDFALNFMKTKKLLDAYNMISKASGAMNNPYPGFPNLNAGGNFNNMDLLKNFLSPEQASTFETMSALMSAMSMS